MEWKDVFTDSYIVLDTESSGLHPDKGDRIIEVGLITIRDHKPVGDAIGWVINPVFPDSFHLQPEIVELTGYTDTVIEYGADPKEFYPSLMNRLFGERIWAHNGNRFDLPFLEAECRRVCAITPPKQNWYDSAAVFKAWQLSLPDKPWTREPYILDELANYDTFYDYANYILEKRIRGLKYNVAFACETLKIDISDLKLHRAHTDVVAEYRLLEKMREIILG